MCVLTRFSLHMVAGPTRSTDINVLEVYAQLFSRYQRGCRSLAENLSKSQSATVVAASTAEMETQEQEEDYDIPEEVENVIGEFLPPPTLNVIRVLKHYLTWSGN